MIATCGQALFWWFLLAVSALVGFFGFLFARTEAREMQRGAFRLKRRDDMSAADQLSALYAVAFRWLRYPAVLAGVVAVVGLIACAAD